MTKIENTTGIPEDDFLREGLIDRLQQYVEADPKAWNVRYNLAVALMEDGQVDEALNQFRQVLAYSPKHLETMINIAGIHLTRGEGDLALKVLTSALVVWDLPVVRANLGMAYLQMGRLEEAERHMKMAVNAAPNMPDALTNLSTALLRLGKLDEAARAANQALEVMPDFAMAHNNLAVILLEAGDADKARYHALRARELGYPVHEDLARDLGL